MYSRSGRSVGCAIWLFTARTFVVDLILYYFVVVASCVHCALPIFYLYYMCIVHAYASHVVHMKCSFGTFYYMNFIDAITKIVHANLKSKQQKWQQKQQQKNSCPHILFMASEYISISELAICFIQLNRTWSHVVKKLE